MKIIRSFLITIVILVQFAIGQNSIQNEINNFSKKESLINASISFLAIDLESKNTIAEFNAVTSLPSASTVKLFSTATALKILGPNYQPSTKIYIDGEIDTQGVLKGNLWIRGGGDPSLGSRFFNEKGKESESIYNWVDSIKNKGILEIEGKVIVDGSDFSYQGVPDGWTWSDMGNYYGAGPSGLVLFDNMLEYHFKTSEAVGEKTTLSSTFPHVEKLEFDNQITSSVKTGDNSYIYGAPYSYSRFGIGSLPVKRNDFIVKGSLPDPEMQMALEMTKALHEKGVAVKNQPSSYRVIQDSLKNDYTNFKEIINHKGLPINEVIEKTNLKSINLFAEQLLFLISKEEKGFGSTQSGIEVIEKCWESSIDFSGLNLTDGSGLSRSNAVSASHFCQLLSSIYNSDIFEDFEKSLPVAGCSGTLSNVCKNQLGHGKIKAKSGTLNRVKAYTGYVDSKSGNKIAFALIVNNYNCSSYQLVKYMENLFNKLAEY